MNYPFIHISCQQDEKDNQFYNYFYDFSDGSFFKINCDDQERIVNENTSINIPSGLGHLGYVFLALLSQFFNQNSDIILIVKINIQSDVNVNLPAAQQVNVL